MMYAIVHDLRTPLSIIIGYNDMEKHCATKNDNYISAIKFSANQLRSMIDQLLAYFRLESNKSTLKPRNFSLMELTNELTTAFDLKASENGISFIKPELQSITLNGDYEKICHIAMNLLDNAFKFTKEGSVSLGITYSDGLLNISVSDTGIGIKAADLERVFTPFTRFSNAVATGKEGFGIGLSTAKMLVDLMEGTIRFDSKENGTKFVVTLPISEAMKVDEPMTEVVIKASGERKRLLVVDDSKTWLLMMQGILEQNGFDCDICSDSGKVFDMIRETMYSMVMLDLQMPGKSGVELLHLMRKSKVGNSQTVPVVASTASAEDIREDLIDAGFDEYIPKMAQTEETVRLINEVIARKTNAVSPDFTKLRKSVAQYLIEETNEAVEGLHKAVEIMDFNGMDSWAHSLKSSWVLYRIGVLVDPVMEIAKKKDATASARLAEYMAEIDKMAGIVIKKAQEKLDSTNE
jgi:CheY-like chemotaxis protein